jgi:hypothetical protein
MDNHDSWETCTTSAECKTIITVVLTVMSGMDPHMISGNLGWVLLSFGWVVSKWVLLGCGSVTVRLCDAIEASSLRSRVCYLFTRTVKARGLTTAFCVSNQGLAFLAINLHVILSSILVSSNHKSIQLACITV